MQTRRVTVVGALLSLGVALGVANGAAGQTDPPVPPTSSTTTPQVDDAPVVEGPQRAFEPVFEGTVEGDLLLIGNSNLLQAGGPRVTSRDIADVDGDRTALCATRLFVPGGCDDNSSSSDLDVPAGARVVAARLYVDTTLARHATSVVARIDGPAEGYDYTDLGPITADIPKLWEASGTGLAGSMMRRAVWDVTDYVTVNGAGTYTVADIVHDPGLSAMPYASWALAVVYELDADAGVDLVSLVPAEQQRFARRSIAWHDGFVVQSGGDLQVTLGVEVPVPAVPFAKSYHVVAHGGVGAFDNLLLDGQPLGNSAMPGNAEPPAGVTVGDDVACNDITDVFNDSICVLGAPVATKAPGADAYSASTGSGVATSGSGVDIDVSRVPDRYLQAGAADATVTVHSVDDRLLAPGLIALSVDLVPGLVDPEPAAPTTVDAATGDAS